MNKIGLLLILLLQSLISCHEEKKTDFIIISGSLLKNEKDSLQLLDKDYKIVKTIYISKNKFTDTVKISEGYYYLSDWNTTTELFLKPGGNLNMKIKYEDKIPSYIFSGNGANENNYLIQKKEYYETFKKVEFFKYYLNLEETNFIKLVDSIFDKKNSFLDVKLKANNNFKLLESFSIEFQRMSLLNSYKKWHGKFINKPNFKVTANYPNPFQHIEISNENLLKHPKYLDANYTFAISKISQSKSKEALLSIFDAIKREIGSQKIIDLLIYNKILFETQNNKNISNEVYKKFTSIVQNNEFKNNIELIYKKRNKISKGKISPSFELFDVNNNLVTLESLKGKLVYIDIWATWCVPCIKEIPAFKKLYSDLKDNEIYFVGICLNDSLENLKEFIQEKKMVGIQLYAPNDSIPFFKDYLLSRIPRYILIDKEGFIIDSYADEPSNPKLKKIILEKL